MIRIYNRVVHFRNVSYYLVHYLLVYLFFSNSIEFIKEGGVGNKKRREETILTYLFIVRNEEDWPHTIWENGMG